MSKPQNQFSFDKRPWTSEEILEELGETMTQEEIASELGCSQAVIGDWIEKLDVDYKTKFDRPKQDHAGFVTREDGYERWKSWDGEKESNNYVYVHRLLAVAEYGFDSVVGNDVHHKNGIPWDNRPENIEILSHGEHMSYHNRKWWERKKKR